jgi:hypothetical protein
MDSARSTKALTLIIAFLATVTAWAFYQYGIETSYIRLWCGVALAAMLSWVWVTLANSSLLDHTLFLLNTAFMLAAVGANQEFYFLRGKPFEPFLGNDAMAVTIAIVAPSQRWIGGSVLGVLVLIPWIHLARWQFPDLIGFPVPAPWRTMIIIFGSACVYEYRLHSLRVERRLIQLRAEAEAIRRYARLMVNARHLAGSPLQIINNAVALLRAQHPVTSSHLDSIDRAADKLERVTRLLAQYEAHVNWSDTERMDDFETLESAIAQELAKAPSPPTVS